MVSIAPSILSADLLQLEKQVHAVEQSGADYIHVDVMDGRFVPNITFGPAMVKALKRITALPLDVHLMIVEPQRYIDDFAAAGAHIITIHQEACVHLDRAIAQIHKAGCKAGVSINPATALENIIPVLSVVDLVLVMSVNPGFGGQEFIPYTLQKMARLREIRDKNGFNFLLEVDGGVNAQNAALIHQHGVDILVAGSAIFGQEDPGAACELLRKKALGEA